MTVDSQEIQPSVFANGRYQVKRFLEEGGKKKVYLATDTLLDRDVAFAPIKTEGLDDGDGVAKIGDFGLAVAIDRCRLTTEGMMVGTVSYMPPEQAMGGAVTPKSDLYSLGPMLYEMVTGRPPFLGDDSVAIIGQHTNTPPVAPTWHNPECPRALEALILRLLAKDPLDRPESGNDVQSALETIDLADIAAEGPPSCDDAHALDSLAGGAFVGRQREMGI